MTMSTKCQKNETKITTNVIQHDDRLWYLRPFYNGAFSIALKHDFDDQFFFAHDSTTLESKAAFVHLNCEHAIRVDESFI
jgi:hypothetical protein